MHDEHNELIHVIFDITELRDKSSYKKVYNDVLEKLTKKLKLRKATYLKVPVDIKLATPTEGVSL